MAHTREALVELYRRRARRYDVTANLYYAFGFRELAYRKRAVAALGLRPGDTVVEIGCGTGLNFHLLERAIGSQGRLIGVDLTDAMLDQARARVMRRGWTNVELVRSDAAQFDFPRPLGGMISTFAITLVPGYDEVIHKAAATLPPGRRIAILDLKEPDGMPEWLVRLGVYVTAPFGVERDYTMRHPWESVERYLTNVTVDDLYFGFSYLAVGEAA